MQCEQLALARVAADERPAAVPGVVDEVDLPIGDVVDRRRRHVARRERQRSPHESPGRADEPVRTGRAEEHEHDDHDRDAVAQHAPVQKREVAHLDETTLSGQTVVSARM